MVSIISKMVMCVCQWYSMIASIILMCENINENISNNGNGNIKYYY